MLGTNNKLEQYTRTLERAYSKMVFYYITETFEPCIENPKKMQKWRIDVATNLLRHAKNSIKMNSPQKDVNDFLGLATDIFHKPIRGDDDNYTIFEQNENGEHTPRQVIKDIDRQICNYLRNELAIPNDDDNQWLFCDVPQDQKDAIRAELDKPLGNYDDIYKGANNG